MRRFTHSFARIYALVCAILRIRLRRFTQSSVVSAAFSDQVSSLHQVADVTSCRRLRYVQQLRKVIVSCKALFEAGDLSKQHPFVWVQLAQVPNLDWYVDVLALYLLRSGLFTNGSLVFVR